tara:strand:- start:1163 stop:1339 length:177 start_codon:yes stop_codon:yes gene_type:complete
MINKMNIHELKLYVLNAGTLSISMTNIDIVLKIILLVISIAYTGQRMWYMYKEKNEKK